jgi:DNA polymerase III sliding clamp (beta) subunit (PCNA family)
MKTIIKVAMMNKRSTRPILRTMLFAGNTAMATDLNVYAHATGPWNFAKPTLVDVDVLKAALSLNKKPVWDGDVLNGIRLENVTGMNAEDFPSAPREVDVDNCWSVAVGLDILNSVKRAMATQDVRYYLNGIYFDFSNKLIAATDGHRLYLQRNCLTISGDLTGSAIVPRSVLDLVDPISFTFAREKLKANPNLDPSLPPVVSNLVIAVTHKGGVLRCKAIDGKFPGYNRVVPQEKDRPVKVVITDKEIQAVKNVAKMAHAVKSKWVGGKIYPDGMIEYAELGHTFKADAFDFSFITPPPCTYRFNLDYLESAIQNGGTLMLSDNPNDSGLVVNGDFTAVIMPMRL